MKMYKAIYVDERYTDKVDAMIAVVVDAMQAEWLDSDIDVDADWTEVDADMEDDTDGRV